MNYLNKTFTFNGINYSIDTEFLFDSLENEIEVITHSLWNDDTDTEVESISIELHQHIEKMMMDVVDQGVGAW